MPPELRALIVAIEGLLEYNSGEEGARGFVREPLYAVYKSFREYVESLPDGRDKTLWLKRGEYYLNEKEQKLAALYK